MSSLSSKAETSEAKCVGSDHKMRADLDLRKLV